MKNSIFMETTKIDSGKTAGQITACLSQYGAQAIMTEFENGEISSISFRIEIGQNPIHFKLPCRWQQIEAILQRKRKGKAGRYYRGTYRKYDNSDQAKRIAWRQILRWVEAQLALVETSMVTMQEVFLPYVQINPKGQTLFEKIKENGFMLEYKKETTHAD